MNSEEINDILQEIKIENFIWIIYIGIILLSWYSNHLEKKYYLYNDEKSKKEYQKIIIFIFTVLCIVYLYFLKDSFDDLKKLKPSDTKKKKELVELAFIASLLIAISGAIFLYIAFNNENLDVEIAFN